MTQNFTRKQKQKIALIRKKNEKKKVVFSVKKHKNIFFPEQSIVSRIGVKFLAKTPNQRKTKKKKAKSLEERRVSFQQQQGQKPQVEHCFPKKRNTFFFKSDGRKPRKRNALIETYRRNKQRIPFWRKNIKLMQYQRRGGDRRIQQISAFALFKKKSMIKNKKKKKAFRTRAKAKLKLQSKLNGAVVKSFHFGKNVYSQYFRRKKLKKTQFSSADRFQKVDSFKQNKSLKNRYKKKEVA